MLQIRSNWQRDSSARIVDGEGVYLMLDDGRRVLDGSDTGAPLGHRHPEMAAAVRSGANLAVINDGWVWPYREKVGEELLSSAFINEESWVGGIRFFISGSEANDMALSLAQALTGRRPLVTRERAYHGMLGLARDVTVQPHWHGGLSRQAGGIEPVPRSVEVRKLPKPSGARYLDKPTPEEPMIDSATADAALSGAAAVIIDYTQGGVYHNSDYQELVASSAQKAGALWIADEVVTGLGRTGKWFSFQGAGSRPDLVTMGKPLAGGAAAAGAIVFSKQVAAQLEGKTWQTYSTFRGHPMMVTATEACLRVVRREGLVERAASLDAFMAERLIEIGERHPSVARIDGRGLHWTVELHGPDWRDWRADSADLPPASVVARGTLEAGALIGTSGEQTSVFLAPALIMPDRELALLLEALDQGLGASDENLA